MGLRVRSDGRREIGGTGENPLIKKVEVKNSLPLFSKNNGNMEVVKKKKDDQTCFLHQITYFCFFKKEKDTKQGLI